MREVLRRKIIEKEELVKKKTYYEDRIIKCDFCKKEIPLNEFYYIIDGDAQYGEEIDCCPDCLKEELFNYVIAQRYGDEVIVYKHRNDYTKNDYTDFIMNGQK